MDAGCGCTSLSCRWRSCCHRCCSSPCRPDSNSAARSDDSGGDGSSRVNIRIPLQLLRAGVRLTSLIPPQALTKVNAELRKSGVPVDLSELKQQHLEELVEQLDDVVVDVDDPEGKVRVFCE
ncbi:hypothetical protein [Streptomyces griseicoloratus]|uniref:hypothetical protein n=1 Tax=Streptomyces griseicoloratus TaxID=2752516 RepID=UPI002810BC6A|nr:hypothetical protein [Streptomyces griseicoloratus]